MKEELLEIYDWETMLPTGKSVSRKEAHKKGIPHEGVHLWISREKNGIPEVVLQRRSKSKEMYPGYLDISVGGHVPFGLYENKIQKEAMEELGINPSEEELILLATYKYEEEIPEINLYHKEIQSIYLIVNDWELDRYRFNDGEVSDVTAVTLDYFKSILSGKEGSTSAENYDGFTVSTIEISKADFHPLFFNSPMKKYMEIVLSCIEKYTRKLSSPR